MRILLLIFHIIASCQGRRRPGLQTVLNLRVPEPMSNRVQNHQYKRYVETGLLCTSTIAFFLVLWLFADKRMPDSVVLWLVCWKTGSLHFWIMPLRLFLLFLIDSGVKYMSSSGSPSTSTCYVQDKLFRHSLLISQEWDGDDLRSCKRQLQLDLPHRKCPNAAEQYSSAKTIWFSNFYMRNRAMAIPAFYWTCKTWPQCSLWRHHFCFPYAAMRSEILTKTMRHKPNKQFHI